MIRRARAWFGRTLDDPWRFIQAYALVLAAVLTVIGLTGSTAPVDERPIVYSEHATR